MPFFAVKTPSHTESCNGSNTSCRRNASILSLPLDTLIHILSFVSPLDILAARKTSKQMMIATCQRIVWINALRLVCLQRGIYTLSFPIKEMSLSQLEHAATTPFRFTNILRSSTHSLTSPWTPPTPPASAGNAVNSNSPTSNNMTMSPGVMSSSAPPSVQPIAIRLLQPRLPRDQMGDNGIFESSYLVPGGRFLLTRSSSNLLQVWDLGYSADMMIKPESIASHHLGDGDLQFDPDAQVTQNGEGLLVFLASENVFRIFEVYPLSESPSFKKVASIDVVLAGRCVYVFTSKLIIYYMSRCLTVWNYIEDTIASWTIRSARVWDIAVSDNHVILLDQTGFSIYKLPPLRPRNTSDTSDPLMALLGTHNQPFIPTQVPLANVQYPISSVLKVADNWSWYTSVNDSRPVHFDVLGIGSVPRSSPNHNPNSSSYIFSLNNPSYHDPSLVDSDNVDEATESSSGDALVVARYTLKKVKNDPQDGLPEYMPVLVEHVRLGGHVQPNVDNARSIRTGSRDLVLMWPSLQGKKLYVYYSDLEGGGTQQAADDAENLQSTPSQGEYEGAEEEVVRPPRTRPRPRVGSLEISGVFTGEVICCPFAGRVCSIDASGAIHVMDYVRPVGS